MRTPTILYNKQQQQQHVICSDYSKLYERNMNTQESMAVTLRGFYYLLTGKSTQCIRHARRHLFPRKCQGHMGWEKKTCPSRWNETKLHQYFFSHAYPVRIAMLVVLNANPIVRSIISCFQKYMETKGNEIVFPPTRRPFWRPTILAKCRKNGRDNWILKTCNKPFRTS